MEYWSIGTLEHWNNRAVLTFAFASGCSLLATGTSSGPKARGQKPVARSGPQLKVDA